MILPLQKIKEELVTFLKNIDLPDNGSQTLIRFAFKICSLDADLIVDSVIRESNKVFYFNRPEENTVFIAFDETFSIKINGNNKFSNLRTKASDLKVNSIDNFRKNLYPDFPLFLGGTKFCSLNRPDEWEDFSDNDWFIPKILFYKKEGTGYLIINLIANDILAIEANLNDLLGQLENIKRTEVHSGSSEQIVSIKVNRDNDESNKWDILVNDALRQIADGLFRKVVLSRRLVASISGSPSFHYILQQLQNNYGNCSIFIYKSGDSVLFGATPEQLLKFRYNEIEFDALAGSARRGVTIEEDDNIANNLLNDKKNRNEHNHVIEFLREVSRRYVQDFRQSKTCIRKFSNIQHIYTPIKGFLKTKEQIYDLVEDIFPTPAICGSPKDAALKYIIENEQFDRGMYSGIVGFMNNDEMDLSVAIRSALLTKNQLFIYAGCGIVEGSDPQSEFEETEIKMKPILSLFQNEN